MNLFRTGQNSVTNDNGIPIDPLTTTNYEYTQLPQTNDWWSSLIMPRLGNQHSEPLYAHPYSLQAQNNGLAIGYTQEPDFAYWDGKMTGYNYNFREDFRIGLENLSSNETRVDSASDWVVTTQLSDCLLYTSDAADE